MGYDAAERNKFKRELETAMRKLTSLIRDENGGEVLEYALIAGLIVVAAVAVISSVGTKVFAKWNSLNDGL
jgi:Flp pilus assembly pilin Flp